MDYSKRIHCSVKGNVNLLGQRALHTVIRQPKKLKFLLEQGLDPTIGDYHGRTPLIYAVAYGELESARILLGTYAKLRINPTGRDELRSQNFVDYAILRGHNRIIFDAINLYTQMGGISQELALNIADYAAERYLRGQLRGVDLAILQPHWSTEASSETIQELLSNGADINRITLSGDTLLHLIRPSEDAHTILDFMTSTPSDRGVTRFQEKTPLIDYSNNLGESPLMVATLHGNVSVIERYLQAGAHINTRNKSGRTALHYVVRDIVSRGWSFGAFDYKHTLDKSEMIGILLSQGADPTIGDRCRCACMPNGCTPLTYMAAGRDRFSMYRGNIGPWLLEWCILLSERSLKERIASTVVELVRIIFIGGFGEDGLRHVCCAGARSGRHLPLISTAEPDAGMSEHEAAEQQRILDKESSSIDNFKALVEEPKEKGRDGNDPDWIILLARWWKDIEKSNKVVSKKFMTEHRQVSRRPFA